MRTQRYIKRMLHESLMEQRLIKEVMDREYEPYAFEKVDEYGNNIDYTFQAADGLPMFASIWHNSENHAYGEYEVAFGFVGQESATDTSKKGHDNFMRVLATVTKIVEEVAVEHNIGKIFIEGSVQSGERGSKITGTKRSRLYYMYLTRVKKYPMDAIKLSGNMIRLDMKKILPGQIDDADDPLEMKFVELLVEMCGDEDTRREIMDDIRVGDNGHFSINTQIPHKEMGYIEFDIMTFPECSLEWTMDQTLEEGEERFGSPEEMYEFMKRKFLYVKTPVPNTQDFKQMVQDINIEMEHHMKGKFILIPNFQTMTVDVKERGRNPLVGRIKYDTGKACYTHEFNGYEFCNTPDIFVDELVSSFKQSL